MDIDNVNDQRLKRFRFLKRVYELSGGDQRTLVPYAQLGEELEFDGTALRVLRQYFVEEGLIRSIGAEFAQITHEGIVQVEDAIANPEKPTQYFPPVVNVIHVETMNGSQIQQGTTLSIQSYENLNFDPEKLRSFVDEFRKKMDELRLDAERRLEAEAELRTIEAQISSSRPKRGILTESLRSLRSILEGAAGSIVAAGLLALL